MQWKKLGLVYCPDGSKWWARSHAMIPTPLILNDDVVRVFITCCDDDVVGRVGYVDIDSRNPIRVLGVSENPVLDIGRPGAFDENGSIACSVTNTPSGDSLMYYVGFELGTQIRYRLLTGLAVQEKGKTDFSRFSRAPILERSDSELYFRCGPYVLQENSRYRMWYVAGSEWEKVGDSIKPVYDLRYMESEDGFNWPNHGDACIRIEKDNEHGFGRPYVLMHNNEYRMFYSVRRRDVESYRLGYAESSDGLRWIRKDEEIGLDVSTSGWDSEMICYSAVVNLHGRWFMFYNGNDFGRTGFGVAELMSW